MASKAKTKPAQFNEIGKKGRFTGVELPHAPRRTFGTSGNGGADDDDMFEDPYLAAMSPDKGGVGASGVKGKKKRGSERNAQFNEIGKKGRFTGIEISQTSLDSNGFERPERFFAQNPPQSAERTFDEDETLAFVAGNPDLGIPPPDQDEDDGGGYGEQSMSLVNSSTPRLHPSVRAKISTPANPQHRDPNISVNLSVSPIARIGSPHRFGASQSRAKHQIPVHPLANRADLDTSGSPRAGTSKGSRRSGTAQQDSGDGDEGSNLTTRETGLDDRYEPMSRSPRREVEDEEEGGEDEQGQEWVDDGGGFQDALEAIPEEEEEEEGQHNYKSELVTKKTKEAHRRGGSRSAVAPRGMKRGRRELEDSDEENQGVRRSNRVRIRPVRGYCGEKVIYKRVTGGGFELQEVLEMPEAERQFLPQKKYGKRGVKRERSASVAPPGAQNAKNTKPQVFCIGPNGKAYPVENCDKRTESEVRVWNYEGDCEIERRIAFTHRMMNLKGSGTKTFEFQKIFNELDYLAGGILRLDPAPSGEKPIKPARDNSYIFIVLEGAVEVTVHGTKFTIGPRGMFMVPRGNTYAIKNIAQIHTELFFAQSRRVPEDEAGMVLPDPDTLRREQSMSQMSMRQAEEEAEAEEGEEEDQEEGEEENDAAPPPKKKGKKAFTEEEDEEVNQPKKKAKGKKSGKKN